MHTYTCTHIHTHKYIHTNTYTHIHTHIYCEFTPFRCVSLILPLSCSWGKAQGAWVGGFDLSHDLVAWSLEKVLSLGSLVLGQGPLYLSGEADFSSSVVLHQFDIGSGAGSFKLGLASGCSFHQGWNLQLVLLPLAMRRPLSRRNWQCWCRLSTQLLIQLTHGRKRWKC